MTKLLTTLCMFLIAHFISLSAFAMPSADKVQSLSAHVVKVYATLANGSLSKGSGVVVAHDQVITNCHVVANGHKIEVFNNGVSHVATAIKTDWQHDLCMVKVSGLNLPIAKIGSSDKLNYEQPVFTVGYPSDSPKTVSTFGVVKALYPMDDSVIVRTTSSFKLGASGGAVFDENGHLVAIITLKSPGKNAYYYNMSVEWVKSLLTAPEQAVITASTDYKAPFWNTPQDQWPYFMRVVKPVQNENWQGLLNVASAWTDAEPNNHEAWYYLALAEEGMKEHDLAAQHFSLVLAQNSNNSDALNHLNLISKQVTSRPNHWM